MKKANTEWKIIKYMLKTCLKERKRLLWVYVLRLFTILFQNAQNILLPKFIIDELVLIYKGADAAAHLQKVIFFVLIMFGLRFVSELFNNLAMQIESCAGEWFNEYFNVKTLEQIMDLDFEQTEDPQVLDQLNKAKDGIGWYSGNVIGILNQFFTIINNVILLCGVAAIIVLKFPLALPVIVLALVLTAVCNKRINQIQIESWQKLAKSNRVFGYLYFEIVEPRCGKVVRLYNGEPLFTKKAMERLKEQEAIWTEQAEGSKLQEYLITFIAVCNSVFSYGYAGYKAIKHLITIGDFSMCTEAASTFYECINTIVRCIQEIKKRCSYADEYVKFMELPCAITKGTRELEKVDKHVIEFKDVSFKYPRSDNFVLEHVNLRIESGEHLAVVGLNGAGKTTFIKLLCRLYDVTSGEILIDGINIKEYTDKEYHKLFAVVFQDFSLLAFSLRENILLKNDDAGFTEEEEKAVDDVLEQVGLKEYVQSLEKKNGTFIDKRFEEDGTEFSGGQKQKVAIARALYKNSPIVILDEPTAALDPIAEAEIYSQFNTNLAGGKTAIYISHRLSSCKFCDKIAVFSEHTIKEYGNHDELMKIKGGIYENMFTTQAKQYRTLPLTHLKVMSKIETNSI